MRNLQTYIQIMLVEECNYNYIFKPALRERQRQRDRQADRQTERDRDRHRQVIVKSTDLYTNRRSRPNLHTSCISAYLSRSEVG